MFEIPARSSRRGRRWGAVVAALAIAICWAGPAVAFDHGPLDRILRQHVKHGRVDYRGIKAKAAPQLDAYTAAIGAATLGGMARDAKLAFYLNAYNALVIKAVVDRYPIKSVMNVKGFFDKLRHKVAGRSLTLNQLENKVIRPAFGEPRIHFALVCAARSCPPLQARAFAAKTLEKDLARLARSFINSPAGVKIRGNEIAVSKLFEWYAADFKKAGGTVPKYLAKYRDGDAARLAAADGRISFQAYDWALNSK